MSDELIEEGRRALANLERAAAECNDYYCGQDSPEHFDAYDQCIAVLAKMVGETYD